MPAEITIHQSPLPYIESLLSRGGGFYENDIMGKSSKAYLGGGGGGGYRPLYDLNKSGGINNSSLYDRTAAFSTSYGKPYTTRPLYQPPAHLMDPYLSKRTSLPTDLYLPPFTPSPYPSYNSTVGPSYIWGSLKTDSGGLLGSNILNATMYSSNPTQFSWNNHGSNANSLGIYYYPTNYSFSYGGVRTPSIYNSPSTYDYDLTYPHRRHNRSYYDDDIFDNHSSLDVRRLSTPALFDRGLTGYASKYYGNPRTQYLGFPGQTNKSCVTSSTTSRIGGDFGGCPIISSTTKTYNTNESSGIGAIDAVPLSDKYFPLSKYNNYGVYYPYSRYIDAYYPLSTYKRGLKTYFGLDPLD